MKYLRFKRAIKYNRWQFQKKTIYSIRKNQSDKIL